MIMGFIIWSIIAIVFVGIGIQCGKSKEAVGFFTFAKPPVVKDVEQYNHAVSVMWIISACVLELIGVPFLFLEQNSPVSLLVLFAVVILIIAMIVVYLKIEAKYKK